MHAYSTEIKVGDDYWNVTYVDFDPRMPIDTRHEITDKALRTLKKRSKRTNIKGDGYEGVVNRMGEKIIGSIVGTLLEVLLETDVGEQRQAILAKRSIDYSQN